MDTEKKLISNLKKSCRKNEKKKKNEDGVLEEVCQQMSRLAEEDAGGSVSTSSTDSEDLVNAINYNTITSLAALKDIIQGDSNDTPETDTFFQHYFMNHCNSLSSRNNAPFPFPERRRLSQCREEDEDDEKKDSDILSSTIWKEMSSEIIQESQPDNVTKQLETEDQNANVVSDMSSGDSQVIPDGQDRPKRTVMGARHKFLVTTTEPPTTAPPLIERALRSHIHNAHTVHFGTKGAEEQRPNVRSIFAGQNLHHDKHYFDSSLIEIRSTVDGTPASSEDIWVKRTEDKPKVSIVT